MKDKPKEKLENPDGFLIIPLGAIGALFGLAVVLLSPGETPQSVAFRQNPEFVVWLFTIVVQATLFAILPLFLFKALIKLKQYASKHIVKIVLSSLGFLFLADLPSTFLGLGRLVSFSFPLAYHELRFRILTITGLLTTALPASIGIWLVYSALTVSFKETHINKESAGHYLFLHRQLHIFLFILGLIVSVATLATGASRRALIAAGIPAEAFPLELVLVYGGYYTFLIALLYIPVYLSLIEFGRRLVDRFYPLSALELESEEWENTYEKRGKLEELLRLRVTAQQGLETGVAIFAPLLSGFISFLVK